MFKGFKEFITGGNLIDTAIAFVMGLAFGKVVGAFIDGIVMPLISTIAAVDLSAWKTVMKEAVVAADGKVTSPEIAIKFGDFVSAIVYLITVGFVMFMVGKAVAKAKKAEVPPPPPPPPASETLLGEIRDLLKSGK